MLPARHPSTQAVHGRSREELDSQPLESLGLTKREAEVLLWISEGKRNSEIAEILGPRSRTIGKHVESILEKLGVETRTSAAKIASDTLNSHSLRESL